MGTRYSCSNFLLFKPLHSPETLAMSPKGSPEIPSNNTSRTLPQGTTEKLQTHKHTATCHSVSQQPQSCPHTRTGEAPEPSQTCQRRGLSQKGKASSPRAEWTTLCQRAEAVLLTEGHPKRPPHLITVTVPALTSLPAT